MDICTMIVYVSFLNKKGYDTEKTSDNLIEES